MDTTTCPSAPGARHRCGPTRPRSRRRESTPIPAASPSCAAGPDVEVQAILAHVRLQLGGVALRTHGPNAVAWKDALATAPRAAAPSIADRQPAVARRECPSKRECPVRARHQPGFGLHDAPGSARAPPALPGITSNSICTSARHGTGRFGRFAMDGFARTVRENRKGRRGEVANREIGWR